MYYAKLVEFAKKKGIELRVEDFLDVGAMFSPDTELGEKEAPSTARKVDSRIFPKPYLPSHTKELSEDFRTGSDFIYDSNKSLYKPLDENYRVHSPTDHTRGTLKVFRNEHIPFIIRKSREEIKGIKGELVTHPKRGFSVTRIGSEHISGNGLWSEIGILTPLDGMTKAIEHKANYRASRSSSCEREKSDLALESKELFNIMHEITNFREVDTDIRTEIILAGEGKPYNGTSKFDERDLKFFKEEPFDRKYSKIYRGDRYWKTLQDQSELMQTKYAKPGQEKLYYFLNWLHDEYILALRMNTLDTKKPSDIKMRIFVSDLYRNGKIAEDALIKDAFAKNDKNNYLKDTYGLTKTEFKGIQVASFSKDYHGPIMNEIERKFVIEPYLKRTNKSQNCNESKR